MEDGSSRNESDQSSANEGVTVEVGNSRTVANSENDRESGGFNWASCLRCCFCGDR